MRILVSPDSFKGSLSSEAAARAIARGCRRILPDAEVVLFPLADGGDGTVAVLRRIVGGRLVAARAVDPLNRPIAAARWLRKGSRAFVETAQAAGLILLSPSERDPLAATSFGAGMLILAAARAGCREIFVGLGGSATTDGGIGALSALGVRFLRTDGSRILPGTGRDLADISDADPSGLSPLLRDRKVVILSDVVNPLCGPAGAAAVYGPQKGAGPEAVRLLDRGLRRFARIAKRTAGRDVLRLPGAGAAGGMAAGFAAFLSAEIASGIGTILEMGGYDRLLARSDILFTGEGRLDGQSFSGKVLGELFRRARGRGVPVVALAGAVTPEARRAAGPGTAVFPIVPGPVPLEKAMAEAGPLLADAAAEALKTVLLAASAPRRRLSPERRNPLRQ